MDRRVFLKSSASAAASCSVICAGGLLAPSPAMQPANAIGITATAEFLPLAQQFAERAATLSAGGLALKVSEPQAYAHALRHAVTFGSLHEAVAQHPGFAYFAGLPGALGMPALAAHNWREHDARTLWQRLQQAAGVVCLPAGFTAGGDIVWSRASITEVSDLYGQRVACTGLSGDVLRGIGAITVDDADATGDQIHHGLRAGHLPSWPHRDSCKLRVHTRSVILRAASPVMIMVQRATWNRLTPDERGALRSAAGSLLVQSPPHPRKPPNAATPSPSLAATVDRIAEAVVADTAGHDRLTRQIDAAYFAAWRWKGPYHAGLAV